MEQLDLFHGELVAFVPTLQVVLRWHGDGYLLAEWSGWNDDGPGGTQRFSHWGWALASGLFDRDDVVVKVR